MKKYITAAALLAAGTAFANAFDNTIWDFENVLSSQMGSGLHSAASMTASGDVEYVDSGLSEGTKIGDYVLNANLGKALSLSESAYLKVGDAYWSNGAGKLWTGTSGQSFTIMAYVRFDSISGAQAIFGTGDNNGSGITFGLIDGANLNFCNKSVADNKIAASALVANTWYNLAVSYDQSEDTLSYYLNGNLVGTDDAPGNTTGPGGAGAAIGAKSKDNPTDYLNGDIAQLKILSGALTQEEILTAASLTVVPEPSAFGLLAGIGALALVASRRRRK